MAFQSKRSWAEATGIYTDIDHAGTVEGCDLGQGDSAVKPSLKGLTVKGCLLSMVELSQE